MCDLCQEIAGGRSVDVIEIDAASNTKVEETKSILEGVRYLPARARRKVYIIDEVHMLSAHSFNALLKTLEEPPPHVVFVFATTEVHKIPVTILSRCQRFDFKLISTVRLAAHLDGILRAEKIDAAPDAVRLIARQAAGSVRDALSLLDQAIAYVGTEPLTAEVTADVLGIADRRLLVELAGAALDRDAGTALRLVARAADRGVDFGELGRSFLGFLRDLEVVARVSGSGKVELPIWSTRRRRRSRRRAPWRPARRRGCFRCCSIAGRVPSTRRRACRRRVCCSRWRRSISARRSRWCRWAICCSGWTSWRRGFAAAAPRAPGRAGDAPPRAGRPRPGTGNTPQGAPSAQRAPAGAARPNRRPRRRRSQTAAGRRRGRTGATARPPAGAGRSPAEIWRRVMTAFEAQGPRLARCSRTPRWCRCLRASCHAGIREQAGRRAGRRSRAREIEQATSASHRARRVKVSFSVGARGRRPVLRSEVGTETDAANADRQKREAEARQHPVIRRAQDVFGAALKEIKTPSHVDARSQRPARDRPAHPERGGAGSGRARAEDRRGRNRRRPLPLHGERPRRGPVADHRRADRRRQEDDRGPGGGRHQHRPDPARELAEADLSRATGGMPLPPGLFGG